MALPAVVLNQPDEFEKPPALYFRREYNAYECLGCNDLIELRKFAVLTIEGVQQEVRIAGHPENLMLWLEMHALDHAPCHKFKDAAMARDARKHRKRIHLRRAR